MRRFPLCRQFDSMDCGATVRQDRTKGAFGGCLTLILAVNAKLLWGELYPRHENQTKNPAETTGTDIKIKF